MKPLTRRSALGALAAGTRTARSAPATGPRPTPAQLAWQDFELGLVYHYDLPVFAPEGWTSLKGTLDPNLYGPARLDTDQWLEAAQAMGCRYAIFTATHFNGFLQWQSDLYPYGLKQTRWRGGAADVFGDFVKSCRRYKIAPGVYLSCHRNAWWKVWGYRVNWGKGGEGQREFARMGARMTAELCSRYGPLAEIWYDAGLLHPDDGGPDVLPVVDRYQKQIVFYHSPQRREHRWIGNEDGVAGYPCWATMTSLDAANRAHHGGHPDWRSQLAHGDPDGTLWSPAMVDVPIRDHEWFWRPGDDHKVYRPEALVEMYYNSVGRNCTLILGATPDRDGLIPAEDFRSYAAFGKEIRRRFGKPLAETRGAGATLELRLARPERIDHVSMMEEIVDGERMREYIVEGLAPGNRWEKICDGTSIGHKRIQKFAPREVASVRLRATRSTGPVKIRQLAVYAVERS